MDNLEIRHDPRSNVSEAPLQMKSNCGCLLIDDFGRQRIEPAQLLNRWIVPLEKRHDFLTLPTGKKIQVPFEQLIIFSTNLEPRDLVDEAFLRRIPYKIEIGDPSEEEFHQLFQLYSRDVRLRVSPRGGRRPAASGTIRAANRRCAAASRATCCCRSAAIATTRGLPMEMRTGVFRPGRKDVFRHGAGRERLAARTGSCMHESAHRPLHRAIQHDSDHDECRCPTTFSPTEPIPGYRDARAARRRRLWRSLEGRTRPAEWPRRSRSSTAAATTSGPARELSALNRIKEVRHPFLLSLERIELRRRPPDHRHRAGHVEPEAGVRQASRRPGRPAFPAANCWPTCTTRPTPWTTSASSIAAAPRHQAREPAAGRRPHQGGRLRAGQGPAGGEHARSWAA